MSLSEADTRAELSDSILVKAHHKLDAVVDAAYAKRKFTGDSDRIAFLFELYQQIVSPLDSKKTTRRKRVIS
jgi:hypothetical protein